MSYSIIGKNFILCCGNTEFVCPICKRPDDGDDFANALSKSKRGFIYRNCKGCNRKLFITSDMCGDLVVLEHKSTA